MSWALRFAIGSFLLSGIGATIIAWACMSTGWETLSRLVWGLLTAGGRTNCKRAVLYRQRCDSPAMAHIFSRAVGRFGFAVSFATPLCQVCMMKC